MDASTWCRACGHVQATQTGPCPSCGVVLAVGPPDDSPLGLAFEVRGRLGVTKRQGVCVGVEDGNLLLHFSAKDREPGRIPVGTAPSSLVPSALSAVTRLLYGADIVPDRIGWDRDMLRQRAAELCADIRVVRRLADEALDLGWAHIVTWVPLTPAEKAWRRAHHAASGGDLVALHQALAELPPDGYAARAALLLPHVGAVHRDLPTWGSLLDAWCEQAVPRAAELRTLVTGPWDAALDVAGVFLPQQRAPVWSAAAAQLRDAPDLVPPPVPDVPAWSAAALVLPPSAAGPLDDVAGALAGLERALWDDLVDAGRVSSPPAVAALPGPQRRYLLARIDPAALDDSALAGVGHLGELARRCFLSRDRARLSGLEPTTRVLHYQALLDVVETGAIDDARLDPRTVATLRSPTHALGLIKDGALDRLPDDVAADPSLWPMFAELAVTGKLLPDPVRPPDSPLNVWIGVQRLLGLVWEGRFADAVEHAELLLPHVRVERVQDEVLSLLAFALDALGRSEEALRRLDEALKGEYTENLLVNAAVIAARTRPEVGVRHLARLVDEAPTPELRRAGLVRAVELWQGSGLDFPPVLVPALRAVLSAPLPIADYLRLGGIAARSAPDIVAGLPNPGGELDGPYRIVQALGRLEREADFGMSDLARAFIEVYHSVGRPEWFDDEWDPWVKATRSSVFVDFGEAVGAAMFIDAVLMGAPELFTAEQRFVMAPQAGAHLNALFRREGGVLNEQAMGKFFFGPVDEFLAVRQTMDPAQAELFADNFSLCMGNAAINLISTGRDDIAERYNGLLQRLRWDTENRGAIKAQMRRVLDEAESGPVRMVAGVVERLRRLGSQERDDLTRALARDLADWRDEISRLRRNL